MTVCYGGRGSRAGPKPGPAQRGPPEPLPFDTTRPDTRQQSGPKHPFPRLPPRLTTPRSNGPGLAWPFPDPAAASRVSRLAM